MRAGADSVTDRMTRLSRITRFGKAGAAPPVQLRQGGARPAPVGDGRVHRHQLLFEAPVLVAHFARAEVLRVITPVAVRADPDLEQRRLVLLDGAVGGCRERPNARPRPDERVAERELDLSAPARPF